MVVEMVELVELLCTDGGSWWRSGGVAVEDWWVSGEQLPLFPPVPPLLLLHSIAGKISSKNSDWSLTILLAS